MRIGWRWKPRRSKKGSRTRPTTRRPFLEALETRLLLTTPPADDPASPEDPYVDPSDDSGDDDATDTAASTDPASGGCTGNVAVQTQDDQLSVWHNSSENPFDGSVLDNDTSGDPCVLLVASLATAPGGGVVELSADGQFTYTPSAGFVGTDSFTYLAEDDQGLSSALGTVTIIVNNDAPVACDDPYHVTADQDDDCYSVAGDPNLVGDDSSDPFDSPFNQFDQFADAVVEPGYPVWNDGNLQNPIVGYEGSAGQGDFFANVVVNDVDEDPLAASVLCEPHFGRLDLQPDGSFAYDADPWFIGRDSFHYEITDGAASDSAEVRLDVHGEPTPILSSATEALEPPEPFRLSRFEHRKCDQAIADSIVYLFDAAQSDGDAHVFALEYLDAGDTIREEITLDVAANLYTDDAGRVYQPDPLATAGWYTDGALRYLRPEGSQLRFVDLHIEALIHWGDGTATETEAIGQASLAQVAAHDPTAGFYVTGFAELEAFHTYLAADNFLPTVEYWPHWSELSTAYLQHHRLSADSVFYERWPSASSHVEIDVANASLTAASINVASDEAAEFTALVGSFSDANTFDAATSYTATIDWGDGSTSNGVVLGEDGTYTVEGTHTYDVYGSYTFLVTVTDKDGYSASASGTAMIADVLPIAMDDGYTTSHGQQLVVEAGSGVLLNDAEGNLGALTAVVSIPPTHGSLVLQANGGLTYTPSGLFVGQDSFTYVATDGAESSEAATVTITVTNDAPTAVDDIESVVHDRLLVLDARLNDIDPDGDALVVEVASPPSNGTASVADGQLHYVPESGFVGTDSFTYRVYDAFLADDFATVTIEVTNQSPVAEADTHSVVHDRITNLAVLANDSDADDDGLTPVVSTAPLHGSASVLPDGRIAYEPDAGFVGNDSFEYYVDDGAANSSAVTVSLNVVNSPPLVQADGFTVVHDVTLTGNVLANDSDPEADVLSASLAADVAHGQLTLHADGGFVYEPDAGFYGDDSFTYTATDGLLTVGPVVVSIVVENHAPPAADLSGDLLHDRQMSWDLQAGVVDPEGDDFSAAIVSGPDSGTISLELDGTFTYTPNAGYVGADSFVYQLCDDLGLCSEATVTINVTNQSPVAVADNYVLRPNTTTDLHVLANDSDADNDPLTVIIQTGPEHGTATLLANGRVAYEPNPGYVGPDSLQYYVNDLAEDSVTVVVSIDVTNQAPVGTPDSFSVVHDQTLVGSVLTNDSDADEDPLSATLGIGVAHGQLSLNANGGFSYEPDAGFVGADSFSYFLTDGVVTIGPVSVAITVTNAVPVVSHESVSTGHHTPVTVSVARSDADGDSLELLVTETPQNGSVVLNSNGTFTYTPNQGFVGTDEFQYVADDGILQSAPGVVSITVTNDAAVAVDDTYLVPRASEITFDVRDNDLNPDGDMLSVVNLTAPGSGAYAVLVGGSLRYTPDPDFFGLTSFTYQLFDGAEYSNTATVTLDVSPWLLDPPPLPLDVTEQEAFNLPLATLSSLDTSQDADDYSVLIDWGDGQTSEGSVAEFPTGEGESSTPVKVFTVTGSHQYLRNGAYFARLTITDSAGKSIQVEVPIHAANSLFAIDATPLPDLVVGEDAEDTLIDLRDYFQPAIRETLRFSATSSDPSLVKIKSLQAPPAPDLQEWALVLDYQPDQYGTAKITVTVESGESSTLTSITDSFEVVVESVNDWPTATGTLSLTVVEGGTVSSPLHQLFQDLETPTGSLTITGPGVDPAGTFTFNATDQLGHSPVTVKYIMRAEDEHGGVAATPVTVNIVPSDDPPYFTDAPFHPFVDMTYSTPDAVVTYLHGAHPSAPIDFFADEEDENLGLSVTYTNASVFAIPPYIDSGYLFYKIVDDETYFGTSDVVVIATDSSGQTDSTTFTVTADHPTDPDPSPSSHNNGCDANQPPLEVQVSFSLPEDTNGNLSHAPPHPTFVLGTISVFHEGWFEGDVELQFDSNLGAVVGFKEMFGIHQHWLSPQPFLGSGPEAYRDWETEDSWRFLGRPVALSEQFYVDAEHPSVDVLLARENVNAIGTFTATFDGMANTYVPTTVTPQVSDGAGVIITLPPVDTFCASGPAASANSSESVQIMTYQRPVASPPPPSLGTISVYASDAYAAETSDGESPDPASFTFSRIDDGEFLPELDVYYRLNLSPGAAHATDPLVDFANRDFDVGSPGSNASVIIDPHTLIGKVTFPQGGTSATVTLYPRDDKTIEWDELVELELLPYDLHEDLIHKAEGVSFTSFGRTYSVGPAATASATILDNDGLSAVVGLDSSLTDAVNTFQGLPSTLDVPLGAFMPEYSQADWTPIAEAALQLPLSSGAPSELSAEVTIAGITGPPTSLDVTGVSGRLAENPAGELRLNLLGPSNLESVLASGAYDYDVRLTDGQRTRTMRGTVAGLNRSGGAVGDASLGVGWSLAGTQQIVPTDSITPPPSLANLHGSRLTSEGANAATRFGLVGADSSTIWFDAEPLLTPAGSPPQLSDEDAWGTSPPMSDAGLAGASQWARWTHGTQPGSLVQLFATWAPGPGRASNAAYAITGATPFGGSQTSTTVFVNQRNQPNSFVEQGTAWRSLGFYIADSDTVTVELNTRSNSGVFADGLVAAGSTAIATRWDSTSVFDTEVDLQHFEGDLPFVLEDKSGNRSLFNANGLLTQTVLRNEDQIDYTYADVNGDGLAVELETISQQRGFTTTYHYDANGHLDKIVDSAGRETDFTISGGNVQDVTLPDPGNGQPRPVWSFKYNGPAGYLDEITDAAGNITRITRDPIDHRLAEVEVEDPLFSDTWSWEVTPMIVDGIRGQSNPLVLAATSGRIGNLEAATPILREPRETFVDARGNEWVFQRDRLGHVTAQASPDTASTRPLDSTLTASERERLGKNVWWWERNEIGLVTKEIQPAGGGGNTPLPDIATWYVYDEHNDLRDVLYMDGSTEHWEYDPDLHEIVRHIDQAGRITDTQLVGRSPFLVTERNPGGDDRVTGFVYVDGLLQEVVAASGTDDYSSTKTEYYDTGPHQGLPSRVYSAYGSDVETYVEYTYDAYRNLHTMTDKSGRETTTQFNALGQLVMLIEPDPKTGPHGAPTTVFQYDEMGNLRFVTDPRGAQTEHRYDAMNQRVKTLLPIPGGDPATPAQQLVTEYQYDANGNLRREIEHNVNPGTSSHRETVYDYDARNLLQVLTLPDPYPNGATPNAALPGPVATEVTRQPKIEYRYDTHGNLRFETDPRELSDSSGAKIKTTYKYDVLGQLKQVVQPPSSEDWTTLGADGKPIGHASPVTTYHYYDDGLIRQVDRSYGSGATLEVASTNYTYDVFGRLETEQAPADAQGRRLETNYEYDLRDNVIGTTIGPAGLATTTGRYYDKRDRLLAVQHPIDLATNEYVFELYAYGDTSEVQRHLLFLESASAFAHLSDDSSGGHYTTVANVGALKADIELSGAIFQFREYAYDDLGRLVTSRAPDPDGLGSQSSVITTFVHDANGNRTESTVWFEEEANGAPALKALTSTVEYDALNRAWRSQGPHNASGVRPETVIAFNLDGSMASQATKNVLTGQTNANATWNTTVFDYDHAGRLYGTTTTGLPTSFSFTDAAGNTIAAVSPTGQLTTTEYDLLHRPVTSTTFLQDVYGQSSPGSIETNFRYFADGQLRSRFDSIYGEAARTDFQVDALGNQLSTIQRVPGNDPRVTQTSYDIFGRREELNANGNVTHYDYDGFGRLQAETLVGPGATRSYRYDLFGNLTQSIDRNGRTVQYEYDHLGQPLRETWYATDHLSRAAIPVWIDASAGIDDVYQAELAYTTLGELKTAQDQHRDASTGSVYSPNSDYTFVYDSLRRPDAVTQSITGVVSDFTFDYEHDLLGNVTSREVRRDAASLFATSYTYDSLGRLDLLTQSNLAPANGPAASDLSVDYVYSGHQLTGIYRYDASSPATNPCCTHVSKTTFGYTNDGFVETIQHEGHDVPHYIRFHSYGYDESGRVTRYVSRIDPATSTVHDDQRNFNFDALRQLESAETDNGDLLDSFRYDASGNQSDQAAPHNRIVEDTANRYRYDAEGNVAVRWLYEEVVSELIDEENWSTNTNPNSGLTTTTVHSQTVINSGLKTLTAGDYRLHLPAFIIEAAATFSGAVNVGVELLDSAGNPISTVPAIPSQSLSKDLIGSPATYRTESRLLAFALPVEQNVSIRLTLSLPAVSPPQLTYKGRLSLTRLDDLHYYRWDHRNRLSRVAIETDPDASQFGWTDAQFDTHSWDAVTSYAYDVLGHLTGRRHDELTDGIADSVEFYVTENGLPLLLLNEVGQLTGHKVYGNGQLLAVDNIADGEIVWTLADRQGTVRDLYSANSNKSLKPQGAPATSTVRVQRLKYNQFGAPLNSLGHAGELSSAVNAGYLGLVWDRTAGVYFVGQQVYEPVAGRVLSPNPSAELMGANAYVFAGNSPVDRSATGRPSDYNASGSGESFWAIWADLYGPGTRAIGGLQAIGGVAQAAGGVVLSKTGIGAVIGVPIAARGLDDIQAGGRALFTGRSADTLTHQAVQTATGSTTAATVADMTTGFVSAGGAVAVLARGAHVAHLGRLAARLDDIADAGRATVQLVGRADGAFDVWPAGRMASDGRGFCFVAGTAAHSETEISGIWYGLALAPPALGVLIDVGRGFKLRQRSRRQQAFEAWYEEAVVEDSFDSFASDWDNDKTMARGEPRDRLFQAEDNFWQVDEYDQRAAICFGQDSIAVLERSEVSGLVDTVEFSSVHSELLANSQRAPVGLLNRQAARPQPHPPVSPNSRHRLLRGLAATWLGVLCSIALLIGLYRADSSPTRPIEQVRVADRVIADAPRAALATDVARLSGLSVDWSAGELNIEGISDPLRELADEAPAETIAQADYRKLILRAQDVWPDGTVDRINIETLQPWQWIQEHQAHVGAWIPLPLDVEEMGISPGLTGKVIDILPCPKIRPGRGRIVLTTVNHLNRDVRELTLRDASGHEETLRPTGTHQFYSITRGAWLPASELQSGETLDGLHGKVTVLSSRSVPGTHLVYNFTVQGEHLYRVAKSGVLVHNTCAQQADDFITLYHGTSSNRASKIVGNKFYETQGFKGDSVYLAEDYLTAKHFALESLAKYQPGQALPRSHTVIELKVPRKLAEELGIGPASRSRIGADTMQMFPDIDGGTGFERVMRDFEVDLFNKALKAGEIRTQRLRARR